MRTILYSIILSAICLQAQVINRLTFDRFTHYEADDWITYGYSNHITSIDIGPENVYFGTTDGGVLRYNLFDEEWLFPLTSSQGLRSNRVKRVVFDYNSNQLYALTDKGIDVFNLAFQYWQPAGTELPDRKTPEYYRENSADFRFPAFSRPAVSQWPNFFPERNYDIMLDGTIIDPDNFRYQVTDKVVDNWYKLWVGTNGTGVAKGDLDLLEIKFIKQSIAAVKPTDVLIKGNDVWMVGDPFVIDERGIARWNLNQDTWTYYKSGIEYDLFSDRIQVVCSIGKNIYFGTEQGLLAYNVSNEKWINYQRGNVVKSDKIYDLIAHKKKLYIATIYGFFTFDPATKNFTQPDNNFLNQTAVFDLASSDSIVYLATNHGIFAYNPGNGDMSLLQSRTAIADNYISAVGYNNDQLWFAGLNGIGVFDVRKDTWKSYPSLNLSMKMAIKDIAFTDQLVWFATSGGLLKYDKERDYWYIYTTEDGLADNRVNKIDVDGDSLWLSTDSGVTLFRWYREDRFE